MLGVDYVGVGVVISALAAAIVSVIVALRQSTTHAQVQAVQDAVHTSDGRTIGEMVEANEARNVAEDNGGKKP